MLLEHIFELIGIGCLGRTCTPISDYFHDKTTISKEILRVDNYTAKIYQEAMYFTSTIWTKLLTIFKTKVQDFKRILDLDFK